MFIESVQWDHPSTTLVAGPSNSGKTTLISKILQYKNDLFTRPNLKTILFYNQNQDIYKKWFNEGLIDYSSKGLPTLNDFVTTSKFYSSDQGLMVIFDDLGSQVLGNLEFFEHLFVVFI